ncbi:hypothetical protein EJV47_27340 [Hymenobacter gummosus]|uniref:Uncharacterized protein n=1 Tax=Hymenobacter gummosus TaxID=1776032 RepID=A0A3S0J9W4_9BACT|nr:hypothetical protein [Hymenobacter gummosus]RTQ44710.1 hypothetical protein EJV47_27340 [Hymenobacter gummosus]
MRLFSRFVCLLLLLLPAAAVHAQKGPFALKTLKLPAELTERSQQFSGLCLRGSQLLLLGESRLQERMEPKVYALDLPSVDAQLAGKPGELTYKKYRIQGLEGIRARIDSLCQVYEGLEGLTLVGDEAYMSIETTTPSAYCYLIRGTFHDATATITLDAKYLVPLPKPALLNGTHVHNAGFESLTNYHQRLLALFEYNYFPQDNYAYELPTTAGAELPRFVPVDRLPFRVTDMVYEGENRFTAINYFFRGDEDAVYRPAPTDPNARFIQDGAGFKNYCRLIRISYKGKKVSWKPLYELPAEYMTYNWEGLAAYHGGYFLINDKYGPSNQSTLLYLQKTK